MEEGHGKYPSKVMKCGRHGPVRVYALKPGVGTEQQPDTRTKKQKDEDFMAWMMSDDATGAPNGAAHASADQGRGLLSR
jgi:hypothetical protein